LPALIGWKIPGKEVLTVTKPKLQWLPGKDVSI